MLARVIPHRNRRPGIKIPSELPAGYEWGRRKIRPRIVAAIINPSNIKAARSDHISQVATKRSASQRAFIGRIYPMISARLSLPSDCFGSSSISYQYIFPSGTVTSNYFVRMRRSRPVISIGSATPSTPSIVGAISRSEPPGANRVWPSSVSKINGTGFVV